jgi:hypothetical protein
MIFGPSIRWWENGCGVSIRTEPFAELVIERLTKNGIGIGWWKLDDEGYAITFSATFRGAVEAAIRGVEKGTD